MQVKWNVCSFTKAQCIAKVSNISGDASNKVFIEKIIFYYL